MQTPSTDRAVRVLTEHDLRRLRLRSQLLASVPGRSTATAEPDATPGPGKTRCPGKAPGPGDTVRHLLAVQAQNLGGACWSVGQRTPGSTRGDVEAALAAGVVVLTWPMRGTLHLVHADDAGWLLPLLTPRVAVGRGKLWRDAGLTDAVFERAADVLFEALGSGPMARPAVLRTLDDAGIGAGGQRGSHILRHLAERRVIIFGPRQGKTQTFMRYQDLISNGGDALGREESLRLLAVRYMTGHGPATEQDLAWWSGLTLRDSRTALALAGPDLAAITVEDRRYYLDPGALSGYDGSSEGDARAGLAAEAALHAGAAGNRRASRDTAAGARLAVSARDAGQNPPLSPHTVRCSDALLPSVHLLPGFDEYHIGYADRRLILAAENQSQVGPGKNGLFRSPVVVDGVVAGTWAAAERKGNVEVDVSLFSDPGARTLPGVVMRPDADVRRGVESAADAYGRFLGLEAHAGGRPSSCRPEASQPP